MEGVSSLSWRRLSTLIRGLGPNSAAATNAWQRRYQETKGVGGGEVVAVSGKKAATSAFVGLFGGRRKKEQPEL